MKINVQPNKKARPMPETPSVSLTHEAYEKLLELSDTLNISMRRLVSEIVMKVEIEKDEKNGR